MSNLTSKSKFTPFWACGVVRAISHHLLKSWFPNWGQKCILTLLRSLLILGVFHIPLGFAYILIPLYADRVPPWTMKQSTFIFWWDHWSSASLYSAIGTGFHKLLSVFALLYTLHMSKFYMPILVNHRNNIKATPINLYLFGFQQAGKPVFVYISAIFSAVHTYVTRHMIVCSTSLTSFVHEGFISMLTNRPCLGPWTVNASRRFCSASSPNVVSGVLGENIGINSSKRQSGIILHKCIHIYGQYNF